MTTHGDTPPRHVHRLVIRRRTRVLMSIALGLIAGVSIGAAYVYSQMLNIPAWMREADEEVAAIAAEQSTSFEHAILNECSKVRPVDPARRADEPWRSEVWAIALDPAQVNAWIQTNGVRWATHQKPAAETQEAWPRGLVSLRIGTGESGTVRLGATVRDGAGGVRAFGLGVTIRIDDEGLWLNSSSVEVGDIAVSAPWALTQADAALRRAVPEEMQSLPDVQRLVAAAKGETPLVSRPVIRLPDGRKVRILAIEPEGKRLIVTCRTEGRTEGK